MQEIWRPVKDYEGLYEVSNWGRVRSLGKWCNGRNGSKYWRKGKILESQNQNIGYLIVGLSKNGIVKQYLVHRLVAEAFPDMVGWTEGTRGEPFEKLQVNHIDKNKKNNRVENLEWCGAKYNTQYSTGKKVYQYTFNGELVRVWPSTAECERNGYLHSNVSACCRGVTETYKGFHWSYERQELYS